MLLIPLQKLPKNGEDWVKLIIAKGFKKLPKVQNIAQSGHTNYLWACSPSYVIKCFRCTYLNALRYLAGRDEGSYLSVQLSNKFWYCPSRTFSIVLTFHKHNSCLPLGAKWAFIYSIYWAPCILYSDWSKDDCHPPIRLVHFRIDAFCRHFLKVNIPNLQLSLWVDSNF